MLDFYGLREQPFGVTPNPRYLYPSAVHREAMASLICGIEYGVGFTAMISEPGMGKTTLLFDLLNAYREVAPTAFLFDTQCGREELLSLVADEFQIEPASSVPEIRRNLKLFLARNASPRPALLIIDEAHNLDDSVLECVRLFSDFETPDHKLLHIILAGQPPLAEHLARPWLAQLLQRIAIVVRLTPLSAAETGAYIEHRLRCGGYSGSRLFDAHAVSRIHEHSHGVPRLVNTLCLNALLLGCSLQRATISADIIEEVAFDLDVSPTGHFNTGHLNNGASDGIANADEARTACALPISPRSDRLPFAAHLPGANSTCRAEPFPAQPDSLSKPAFQGTVAAMSSQHRAAVRGGHFGAYATQIARPRYAAMLAIALLLMTGPAGLPKMRTSSKIATSPIASSLLPHSMMPVPGMAVQSDVSILPGPNKRALVDHWAAANRPIYRRPATNNPGPPSLPDLSVVGNGMKDAWRWPSLMH